jgi:hypothetical protein
VQHSRRRLRRLDHAAFENAPLDEHGLVDMVVQPSLEIVACHGGSIPGEGAQSFPRTREAQLYELKARTRRLTAQRPTFQASSRSTQYTRRLISAKTIASIGSL